MPSDAIPVAAWSLDVPFEVERMANGFSDAAGATLGLIVALIVFVVTVALGVAGYLIDKRAERRERKANHSSPSS